MLRVKEPSEFCDILFFDEMLYFPDLSLQRLDSHSVAASVQVIQDLQSIQILLHGGSTFPGLRE